MQSLPFLLKLRNNFPIRLRTVVGNSMTPALKPGAIVLVYNRPGKIRLDQIILFRHEGIEKLKRISVMSDAQLFVLGDNQADSYDSRKFGWIDRSMVIGPVIMRLR